MYSDLITTSRSCFFNTVLRTLYNSKNVKIIVGYVSIEGIELLLNALFVPEKIQIIVGVRDEKSLELQLMLQDDTMVSPNKFNNTDTYTAIRYLVKQGKLEFLFVGKNSGCRLLHAKGYCFMLKDNTKYFICGSNNLTKNGLLYNREWAIITDDITICTKAERLYDMNYKMLQQEGLELQDGTYFAEIEDAALWENQKHIKNIEIVYNIKNEGDTGLGYLQVSNIRLTSPIPKIVGELTSATYGVDAFETLEDWVSGLIGLGVYIYIEKNKIVHIYKRLEKMYE